MNWCEINQLLDQSSRGMHHYGHAPCYRTCAHMLDVARTYVLAFYFVDLIFVDRQSTAKTMKIGSLENFRPYSTATLQKWVREYIFCAEFFK